MDGWVAASNLNLNLDAKLWGKLDAQLLGLLPGFRG